MNHPSRTNIYIKSPLCPRWALWQAQKTQNEPNPSVRRHLPGQTSSNSQNEPNKDNARCNRAAPIFNPHGSGGSANGRNAQNEPNSHREHDEKARNEPNLHPSGAAKGQNMRNEPNFILRTAPKTRSEPNFHSGGQNTKDCGLSAICCFLRKRTQFPSPLMPHALHPPP